MMAQIQISTMTASEFAKALADLAPSMSDLKRVGLSDADADRFRKRFLCHKRETPLCNGTASDELAALLQGWRASEVEVGMVSLIDAPITMPNAIQVGLVEADPLVVSQTTGEVVVEEAYTDGHILWRAATNGAHFLDALIVAAKFLTDRAIDKVSFDDFSAARAISVQATALAGGCEFADFYSMLLGAE